MQFFPLSFYAVQKCWKGLLINFEGSTENWYSIIWCIVLQLNEKLHLNYANTYSLILFCQLTIVIDAKKLMRMGLRGFHCRISFVISSAIWVYVDSLCDKVWIFFQAFPSYANFLRDYFLVDFNWKRVSCFWNVT